MRRNRVHGACRCPECGQSFVNTARLERHLAVHQVFGSYLCPLCGKTYKYEYNLFYHWRRNCRDLNELIPLDERKTMDVNALRELVDEVAQKKAEIGPIVMPHPHYSAAGDELFDAQNEEEKKEDQLIYGDDYMDEYNTIIASIAENDDVLTSLDVTHNSTTPENEKPSWSMSGPVQCPECFRSFVNSGRLDRHLAGFHSAYGSHHCILCGNRFKYDYNLLYHYRRSCPYTKAFIDRDVREQMEAAGLRKLVRNLASRDVHLSSQTYPPPRMGHKQETGDAVVRKEMMKMVFPNQLPPAHLMKARPGLTGGRRCPVCAIFFYGNGVLERHMKAAHSQDYGVWEGGHNGTLSENEEDAQQCMEDEDESETEFADADESPPTLTAEQPSGQPIDCADEDDDQMENEQISNPMQSRARLLGRRPTHHIINEQGISIAQISDISEVQQMIDNGELQVQEGDRIILMEDTEMEEYEDRSSNE